jgi:hypothetical protein
VALGLWAAVFGTLGSPSPSVARTVYTLSLDGPVNAGDARTCVTSPSLLSGSGHGSVAALPDGGIVFSAGGVGTATGLWTSDLSGSTCRLGDPLLAVQDVAVDREGRIVVLSANRLLRVEPDGRVAELHELKVCEPAQGSGCTVACACFEDISPTAAGTILVALGAGGRERVVEVLPGRGQRTVAGTGTAGFSGDGGPATAAQLSQPTGVAATNDGGFLIADSGNNRVRRVAADGTITTVAGTGEAGLGGDGGAATAARLSAVKVAAGPRGGFVVSGTAVRRVTRHGVIRSVAGDRAAEVHFMPDRTTDRLLGNGDNAHKAYVDPYDLAISPHDDYLVAGFRLRMIAAPGTKRLALALRTAVGSRRRVSFAISRAAEVTLKVQSGDRSWVFRQRREAGLGRFRLPRRIPDGLYQLLLAASTDDGQQAEREDTLVLGRRLTKTLTLVAVRYVYGLAPALTPGGLNTHPFRRGDILIDQEDSTRHRCHRFGRLRIDCSLGAPAKWTGGSVNVAVRLDPRQGRLASGAYALGPFRRRPKMFTGREWAPLNLLDRAPWLMGR